MVLRSVNASAPRRLLLMVPVLLLGGCAATAAAGGVATAPAPSTSSAVSTSPAAVRPTPGPGLTADPRFATVSLVGVTAVPDYGLLDVMFRLDGNCPFAEAEDGSLTYLIWPEGHVQFDAGTHRVWFLDIHGRQAVVFGEGQRLDIRALPGRQDSGYQPLDPEAFVVPPDPSCPDQRVALVTGVTIR